VSEGHELAREQIAKHGKDRYPTPWEQFCKVRSELEELRVELELLPAHVHGDDGTVEGCPGCFADEREQRVRDEYADVGLAYFELGNKLNLDAITEMRRLVSADRRTFA
jgi:hypothetical protein